MLFSTILAHPRTLAPWGVERSNQWTPTRNYLNLDTEPQELPASKVDTSFGTVLDKNAIYCTRNCKAMAYWDRNKSQIAQKWNKQSQKIKGRSATSMSGR